MRVFSSTVDNAALISEWNGFVLVTGAHYQDAKPRPGAVCAGAARSSAPRTKQTKPKRMAKKPSR